MSKTPQLLGRAFRLLQNIEGNQHEYLGCFKAFISTRATEEVPIAVLSDSGVHVDYCCTCGPLILGRVESCTPWFFMSNPNPATHSNPHTERTDGKMIFLLSTNNCVPTNNQPQVSFVAHLSNLIPHVFSSQDRHGLMAHPSGSSSGPPSLGLSFIVPRPPCCLATAHW